jgi:hypothetical protein
MHFADCTCTPLPHGEKNVPRWQVYVMQHSTMGHGMTWSAHEAHSELKTTDPPIDCLHVARREYHPAVPQVAHEPTMT